MLLNYLVAGVVTSITMLIVKWLFPTAIPFDMFEFWSIKASVWSAVKSSWLLFVWGGGVTLVFSLLTRNDRDTNRHAERLLIGGFIISVFAGVMEEIIFRWLLFLNGIWGIKLSNWLFFGWAGFGIAEWSYNNIIAPVASFFTLGSIDNILYHPISWSIGAAIIAANAKFRDGHKYQGWFGYINSWFVGMYLFWLMFQYGLIACIVIHFLYDMLIFFIHYLDAAKERAVGYC